MPGIIEQPRSLRTLLDVLESDEHEFKKAYNEAVSITHKVFGRKRTLFNPIYVSNICVADCSYCGYRFSNKKLQRKTLSPNETIQEAIFLHKRGIENILVLAGDYVHDKYLEMLLANIRAIKEAVGPKWLGIEVATLRTKEYEALKDAGVDSVTVFQETYNRERYRELHNDLEYKGDFEFRYAALGRAIESGVTEVGLGVLYGVGFWKDDTIAMAEHAKLLQRQYPQVKLRFSFPRLQDSSGQSEDCKTEEVTREQLLRAIVSIRLSFPNSSLVLTGRESIDLLIDYASIVDVLGYSGSTVVGGYTLNPRGVSQFILNSRNGFTDFSDGLRKHGFELTY